MIERVARDPSIDLDRMDRLMAMHAKIMEREAKTAFDAAFAAMQPELPVVTRRGQISGESRRTGIEIKQSYGRWEDISPAIMPVLAKHGFAITAGGRSGSSAVRPDPPGRSGLRRVASREPAPGSAARSRWRGLEGGISEPVSEQVPPCRPRRSVDGTGGVMVFNPEGMRIGELSSGAWRAGMSGPRRPPAKLRRAIALS
jgi:hypothetical protein